MLENKKVTAAKSDRDTSLELDPTLQRVHLVYREHKTELCAYLVKKLGINSFEAEDVVQGAFEKIVAMSEVQYIAIKNLRAFLYKASFNAAIDLQRRGSVGQRFVDDKKTQLTNHVDNLDPYRRLLGEQQLKVLLATLKKMPEKRRKLIIMNRFDGLSCAEIARRVNLSQTVVRKHLARALAECQHALRLSSGEIGK